MTEIALSEAMIVWTPNTDLWRATKNAAAPGSIMVVRHPDIDGEYTAYPKSDGACTGNWREITDEERLARIRQIRRDMIEHDNMDPAEVDAALSAIRKTQ